MKTPYRLGLDVGSNSIGWCVLDLAPPREPQGDSRALEPCAIRAMGVRIFPDGRDPQSEASLAVDRRDARSQRRRRDRFLYRKQRLMQALIRHGLMPTSRAERKALETQDPYALRARGVTETLTAHQFGRALFHLGQRRGFKSNRKTSAKDDEGKATKEGIEKLQGILEEGGYPTLGAYLHAQREGGEPIRFRPHPSEKNKTQNAWDAYPNRGMYEEEFNLLWERQASHLGLDDKAREDIRHHIFHQRDLKPVKPGRCTFEQGEERAPKALPLNQEFRMRQEIANLQIRYADGRKGGFLTEAQREKVFAKLNRHKEVKFDAIRKELGLDAHDWFNLESEKRQKLDGNETGARLAGKKCFGAKWWEFSPEKQNAIVRTLLEEEDEEKLVRTARQEWGLDEAAVAAVMDDKLLAGGKLEGYGNVSVKALEKILPHLRAGMNYPDAVVAAGYHHSDFRDGEILDELPYYGEPLERHVGFGTGDPNDSDEKRHGRIANPTVHIGLNQIRHLINALIRRYGHPEEVVIELARELKQSLEKRKEIQKDQAANQKKNEGRLAQLEEIGEDDRGDALLRMRLWEELNEKEVHNRRCVYTGRQISIEKLFSNEVEIEHILPFSRTLDNAFSNKTVSFRDANRIKGNRAPHEAQENFARKGWDWDGILRRAEGLPKNKRWRFNEDAMEKFDAEEAFLDRQLVETQYLSRAAKEYLGKICNPNKVWAIPGRLTAMLRGKWGFNGILDVGNFKNRNDHRHHAIDAFVVAVTSRSLLQQFAKNTEEDRERLTPPDPYPRFDREDMKRRVRKIIVSHRPDHSIHGKLLDETAYGVIANPDAWGGHNLVYRKPVESLNANEMTRIRDPKLREELKEAIAPYRGEKDGLLRALQDMRKKKEWRGLRRVRLTKTQQPAHAIRHGGEQGFEKAYLDAGNHHIDILEVVGKKGKKVWIGHGVSMLEANGASAAEPWREKYRNGKLIMRVHKGDLLRLQDKEGVEKVFVVKQLNIRADMLTLSEQNESGNLQKRHDDKDDPFRWLFLSFSKMKERKCRRVTVDFLGRLHDPWPAGTDPKHAPTSNRARKPE